MAIGERERPVFRVPSRHAVVLGVDKQRDAADFAGNADAAFTGAQQQRRAKPAALNRSIDSQPAQAEHRHFVTGQTLFTIAGARAYSIEAGLTV